MLLYADDVGLRPSPCGGVPVQCSCGAFLLQAQVSRHVALRARGCTPALENGADLFSPRLELGQRSSTVVDQGGRPCGSGCSEGQKVTMWFFPSSHFRVPSIHPLFIFPCKRKSCLLLQQPSAYGIAQLYLRSQVESWLQRSQFNESEMQKHLHI